MEKIITFLKYHNGFGKLSDGSCAPSFATANIEILSGAKQSHWIWYLLPTNDKSKTFGDKFTLSNSEIILFIANPTLSKNYVTLLQSILYQLDNGVHPLRLLMSKIDVIKTYESVSLFERYSEFCPILKNTTDKIKNHLKSYAVHYMIDTMLTKNKKVRFLDEIEQINV